MYKVTFVVWKGDERKEYKREYSSKAEMEEKIKEFKKKFRNGYYWKNLP